jgi:ubiquinone/menaquinone biosynthesis C-methylase UbiE
VRPTSAEFDSYSQSYEELLKDPVRDLFSENSEFFHLRKRDLLLAYFQSRTMNTPGLKFLDLGCGKGELLRLMQPYFGSVIGCDPSAGMLQGAELATNDVEVRLQTDLQKIPMEDSSVDCVTAVCVYHHVPPNARAALTREVYRVLKPKGVFAIIEHNPWNPVTRLIVSRTPVDADAVLLRPGETRTLLKQQAFTIDRERYFLYLPRSLYKKVPLLEDALAGVPLGGQYAVFGIKSGPVQPSGKAAS